MTSNGGAGLDSNYYYVHFLFLQLYGFSDFFKLTDKSKQEVLQGLV